MLPELLREKLNIEERPLLVLTNRNELRERLKRALFSLRKALRLSWSGLAIQTCQLKKTNRGVERILGRGTVVIPRKINFQPDTGHVKHGDDMSPEEVLAKLAHHEEKCDLRYQRIEDRLDDHKEELKWLRKMMWALIIAIMASPWIQRLWGG